MEAKFLFAKQLIKEAGQLIKKGMFSSFEVTEKERFDDLVTSLDEQVQNFLVQRIQSLYPNDAILAEEGNLSHEVVFEGRVWVIDPIDGTVNFVTQGQDFAVMIAYYEDGIGQFGLIYDVIADSLYSGGGQFDVMVNDDRKLMPSESKALERSLIAANSGMYEDNFMGLANLIHKSLGLRIIGSAGISMARVLEGKILAYFSNIYPWDYAAASILGEKLGYQLLTMTGEMPNFKSRQAVMFVPKILIDEFRHAIH